MKPNFTIACLLLACSYLGHAQVAVSKEPRHHNVLENAWVRILDVHILPGDTSLFHRHEIPSVFLVLTKTKTGSQVVVEPMRINLFAGNIWYESFQEKPRVHRVWNSDTSEFHAMDLELVHKDPVEIGAPLEMKPFTLLFDETQVRGYRVVLDAHTAIPLTGQSTPVVVIRLTDGGGDARVNDKDCRKKGDYIFIDAGQEIHFLNLGNARVHFAFLVLK